MSPPLDLLSRLQTAEASGSPLLMGVLNVTPDSFYDGGAYTEAPHLEARVEQLLEDGADIVDVGAESSRPGAAPVSPAEQLRRLRPALALLRRRDALVSVDTTSPEVAESALAEGATIVNDVSCLRDSGLAAVAAAANAWLVISHSRAPMTEMTGFSEWPDDAYGDPVRDVMADWERAKHRAVACGLAAERLIFDPGLGFSKNARQSIELLRRLGDFNQLGHPVLVGPGRKSYIAAVDPAPPEHRLGGTISSCLYAAHRGVAILRVHDVRDVRQALRMDQALRAPEVRPGEPD